MAIGASMRMTWLVVMTAFSSIGACFAQTNAPQASQAENKREPKPTNASPQKDKPTPGKTEKLKKNQRATQTATKFHPEQEQDYDQAYKMGAVR